MSKFKLGDLVVVNKKFKDEFKLLDRPKHWCHSLMIYLGNHIVVDLPKDEGAIVYVVDEMQIRERTLYVHELEMYE